MDGKLIYINELSVKHRSDQIGCKAASLALLQNANIFIPNTLCINTKAYFDFITVNRIDDFIEIELGRKSLDGMRWEELWDCAFRIRNKILQNQIPIEIINEIKASIPDSWLESGLAVRSSSPLEDRQDASFAGLHDSFTKQKTLKSIVVSIKQVWASLWSDRALLYRKELCLDAYDSSMAFILQEMIVGECSGVAFSRDPNNNQSPHAVIEAVPGLCETLMDREVDPNRYKISRNDEVVRVMHEPHQLSSKGPVELILKKILNTLLKIESLFQCPVDVEWTIKDGSLYVLQARPITFKFDPDQKRRWYLTLTPKLKVLKLLAKEVTEELIPDLEAEGYRMAHEALSCLSDGDIANVLTSRLERLHYWRKIYKEKFIPFAHGVRTFGEYYNDTIKPKDPYEFTQLLKSQDRIAKKRISAIHECKQVLDEYPAVLKFLIAHKENKLVHFGSKQRQAIKALEGGRLFLKKYQLLKENYFDMTLNNQRWFDHDNLIIAIILQFSSQENIRVSDERAGSHLLEKYYAASKNKEQAESFLALGRLSWQLRDDDNLLLSRIESQLIRVLNIAQERLVENALLQENISLTQDDVPQVVFSLRECAACKITSKVLEPTKITKKYKLSPRQLKGQPAVPGTASGRAFKIDKLINMDGFLPGDIIVCDAVDPVMTHLVPLSGAIVEQRGGMLVHSVIVARELGIPCVNGVGKMINCIQTGDYITVDGTLGLVIKSSENF